MSWASLTGIDLSWRPQTINTGKLIFKTGSNKYPNWTMPPEIIPIVETELAAYEKSRKPLIKKDRTIPSVFISYSSKDSVFVERLVNDLSRSRKQVWWDHTLVP
jgi:hypothetical protein